MILVWWAVVVVGAILFAIGVAMYQGTHHRE